MSATTPVAAASASAARACSSSKVRGRRRAPNSRLGVVPAASTLPPLAAPEESPRRATLAQQQAEERAALEQQLTDRVRAQTQQTDASRLAEAVASALDASHAELSQAAEDDDAFALAGRLTRVIGTQCPHAAQLLSLLVSQAQGLVQTKLRGESKRADSRRFPPTRVSESERVAPKSAYTPFNHHQWGAVTRGELRIDSDATLAAAGSHDDSRSEDGVCDAVGSPQWTVVLFPRARPSLSREEIGAFMTWAHKKLDQLDDTADCSVKGSDVDDSSNAASTAASRFPSELAVRELVAYELSRLVFDKCPTTARFLHGLFVELQELAARTLAAADKEARVLDQRHRNALLDQQKLKTRLEAVEGSLLALQDTMRRRQHQLLTEREWIIRQRKKLNVLLAADQVVIRRVVGVLQHGIECADELLTNVRDKREGSTDVEMLKAPVAAGSAPYTAVQELVELVATKYAALPEVQQAKRECDEDRKRLSCRENGDGQSLASDGRGSRQVIVLATEDVAVATEELKGAMGRLTRLLTTKCPDSGVGWAAEELWDQALFIPSPEDVQDIARDVQQLCSHVEAFILHKRQRQLLRLHNGRIVHSATQTELTTFGVSSNGQVVVAHSTETPPSTREALLRESNSELLRMFLPEGLRPFVRSIPIDYEPRQLSLTVVHAIISYVLNEMWALVQQENLQSLNATSPLRRFGSSASAPVPTAVRSAHEYLYRIYLEHFQAPAFAVCRLLDLLVSASRLDTQSCKVLLFCRLMRLPGTDPLPPDSFWFLLKALHVLQRSCIGSGNYFLLDAHGVNEFVPQASAWEAVSQLFINAGNDVMKRLRMRLAGLASVFGAVWIPAYNVMEFVVEEWTLGQATLRSALEAAMLTTQSVASSGSSTSHDAVVTYVAFLDVFQSLNLRVSRMEAAQAYRRLLSNAQHRRETSSQTAAGFDLERFNDEWLGLVLAAVNRAQHQQYTSPQAYAASRRPSDVSSGEATGAAVHFGAPCEALVAANASLSRRFLKATWEQTKPDFIRWLDLAFHDIGLQVRLIQQMDGICDSTELTTQQAWRGLQQLVQIVALGSAES